MNLLKQKLCGIEHEIYSAMFTFYNNTTFTTPQNAYYYWNSMQEKVTWLNVYNCLLSYWNNSYWIWVTWGFLDKQLLCVRMNETEVHIHHICSLVLISLLKHSCYLLSNSGESFRWDHFPKEIFCLEESSSGVLSKTGQVEVKYHLDRATILRGEGNPETLCA